MILVPEQKGRQDHRNALGWWWLPLLILVSLSPVIPNWLAPGLPATHEGYRYLLLSGWFADALAAGVWYPRWLPEMNGGFGYPQFVFYQPAYFFLNALLFLVAEPLFLRQLVTLSLIALLGGGGVWLLVRRFTSPGYALLLVFLFQIAPYVHTNLFVRGDLTEWMAQQLIPWPIYFLVRYCDEWQSGLPMRRMVHWLGIVLGVALLCYCHPVALMFLPLLLLCLGGGYLLQKRPLPPVVVWGELGAAIGLGLAASSPYWLTVMQMKPYVTVAAVLDGFVAADNTVGLQPLLWGSLQNQSFREVLGLPFVLAALVGWWRGRKHPLIFTTGVTYLLLIILITPAAAWFWRIYPFSLLQFPWRLAAFAPLLQTICLCGLLAGDGRNRIRKGWLATGFALLLLWSWHGHFGFKPAAAPDSPLRFDRQSLACLRNFAQTGQPGRYVTTLDATEWLPRSATGIKAVPARGALLPGCEGIQQAMAGLAIQMGMPGLYDLNPSPRPLLEVDQPGWTVRQNPGHCGFRLDYQLSGVLPATVTINQIYLPGWKIVLNKVPVSRDELEKQLLPDGRMKLNLAPGSWQLQAWYEGPPGWRLRTGLLLFFSCTALAYWAYRLFAERKNR